MSMLPQPPPDLAEDEIKIYAKQQPTNNYGCVRVLLWFFTPFIVCVAAILVAQVFFNLFGSAWDTGFFLLGFLISIPLGFVDAAMTDKVRLADSQSKTSAYRKQVIFFCSMQFLILLALVTVVMGMCGM